mgnify:FL=1
MDDYGKVTKEKARQLFQYLRDKRVLVKLVVKNTGYESVTVVTDIETIEAQECLRIDCSDDFHIILKSRDCGNLSFEFNGPDKVLYTFETAPDPKWRRG